MKERRERKKCMCKMELKGEMQNQLHTGSWKGINICVKDEK